MIGSFGWGKGGGGFGSWRCRLVSPRLARSLPHLLSPWRLASVAPGQGLEGAGNGLIPLAVPLLLGRKIPPGSSSLPPVLLQAVAAAVCDASSRRLAGSGFQLPLHLLQRASRVFLPTLPCIRCPLPSCLLCRRCGPRLPVLLPQTAGWLRLHAVERQAARLPRRCRLAALGWARKAHAGGAVLCSAAGSREAGKASQRDDPRPVHCRPTCVKQGAAASHALGATRSTSLGMQQAAGLQRGEATCCSKRLALALPA